MKRATTNSTCYQLEGNLFLSNQLEKAFVGQNHRQKPQDYQLPPGITIKEECSRAFRIGKASWDIFAQVFNRTDLTSQDCLSRTREFAKNLLGEALGYQFVPIENVEIGERKYPIAFETSGLQNAKETASLPVALVQPPNTLDTAVKELAVDGGGSSKKSAFSLVQEFLNASDEYRWGFAFNGLTLRLVRDSMSLTRPSFLEFNLQEIFANDDYAEFVHLWMVLHASRVTLTENNTAWDLWIKEGEEEGQPARDALSASIKEALLILGNGFIREPSNDDLRKALSDGSLSAKGYTHELLRLMYRFLFIFCLEERELLYVKENTDANRLARERYQLGYSFHRYREMSRKKRFQNKFMDAWESVKIVFKGLEAGEPLLALPALGGLFNETQCPHLSRAALPNSAFFEAMYSMRWAEINKVLAPIDYKNMGTEELGSIYESLLELVPVVDTTYRTFGFMSDVGASSERKKTGSYYTPDAFVQLLIKSALDPMIEKRLKENPQTPEKALLDLRVIDPACGSGHFLLAAARRIAEKLALSRAHDEIVTPANYRLALRDVIQHCIYGVDLNPLAVELARMALWLEGYAEGMPLSFLDHHLKIGNSLLGVFDLSALNKGIADDAYKVNGQDSKVVCDELKKINKAERKGLIKAQELDAQSLALVYNELDNGYLNQIESIHSSDLAGEISKEKIYQKYLEAFSQSNVKQACDLQIAAYLSDKNEHTKDKVATTAAVSRTYLYPDRLLAQDVIKIQFAQEVCDNAHVFHWPLEFPQVFASGGFDCVLGNPPWEKAKVEDKKWFAKRQPVISKASTAAIRKEMISKLRIGQFSTNYLGVSFSEGRANAEKVLYDQYMRAQKNASSFAVLGHLPEIDGGRFPLTGYGDTNLASYFSELVLQLRKKDGSVGVVVLIGVVTDDATKAYSQYILDGHTRSLYHFNNTEKLFDIDSRYSFVLITLLDSDKTDCVFYATNLAHLDDSQRHVVFEQDDLKLFNPNTRTCVLIRSKKDLELCRKIYNAAPVLIKEEDGESGNPWGLRFMRMFDMTNDSNLFHRKHQDGYVPLYEGKLFHQFDNRWATFDKVNSKQEPVERDVTQSEKEDSTYKIQPRYWLNSKEVKAKFLDKKNKSLWWTESWMMAFRKISRATDERTVISTVLPSEYAIGDGAPIFLPTKKHKDQYLCSCLLANVNSLIVDFICRIKQSGANLNIFIFKQLPILKPEQYTRDDICFIVPRVALLTRNSVEINDIWLTKYASYQFQKSEERLQIRAELDAYFAHLYGLTRDELRYILDPSDVMGENFHSVTFPGLKANEKKKFGEYLTQRLVLEVYDELAKTERFSNKANA